MCIEAFVMRFATRSRKKHNYYPKYQQDNNTIQLRYFINIYQKTGLFYYIKFTISFVIFYFVTV
ncbi:hypothetical protein GT2_22_00550 [Parageobacillus thermoglucosidasius NBRC 107763]|nr:hypothetical protein GT2_22_00550 [Parageobacillus thermoglucosidasius NBRC 107763]